MESDTILWGFRMFWDFNGRICWSPTFSDRRVNNRWSFPSLANNGKRTEYLLDDKWEYLVPTSYFLKRALASSIKMFLKWKQTTHFSHQSYGKKLLVLPLFLLCCVSSGLPFRSLSVLFNNMAKVIIPKSHDCRQNKMRQNTTVVVPSLICGFAFRSFGSLRSTTVWKYEKFQKNTIYKF